MNSYFFAYFKEMSYFPCIFKKVNIFFNSKFAQVYFLLAINMVSVMKSTEKHCFVLLHLIQNAEEKIVTQASSSTMILIIDNVYF